MVMAGLNRPGRKGVFLDRDGILVVPEFRNGRSYAARSLETFAIDQDAPPALERLRQAGFALIVVTNQPDVGAGLVGEQVLEDMHLKLRKAMPVDRIEVCTHTADRGCDCRKPNPGMLLNAAEALGIDLSRSFMVGDRSGDIEAGRRAGCRTAFRDLSYTAEAAPEDADFRSTSLPAIIDWILSADAAVNRD